MPFGPPPLRLYTSTLPNGTIWSPLMMNWLNRSKGLARLRIAFGKGERPACGDLYGVPFLLRECISEVARGTAGALAVARLGACHHEPRMRARWQGLLERTPLHV